VSKPKTKKPEPPKKVKPAKAKPAAPASATDVTEVPKKRKRNNNSVDPKSRGGEVKPVTPDKVETPEFISRGLEIGLTLQMIEFVQIYLTSYNQTRSYMAAYNCQKYATASVEATKLMADTRVRQYLFERMEAAFKRTEIAQQELIQLYTHLAYGDVNELVEFRRDSCRYCHGEGHKYQRTPAEREDALADYERQKRDAIVANKSGAELIFEPFHELGGVGYCPNRPPHQDCPECHGEGVGRVHFHDTRYLSPAAKALYEGAKVGKDGIEVKVSRDGAREKLAKILKIYDDSKSDVFVINHEELERVYGAAMEKARQRAEEIRQERGLSGD
jgi:phage terminase small subunit